MEFLLSYTVVVVLFNCQILTISYLCLIYKLNFSVRHFHAFQKRDHAIQMVIPWMSLLDKGKYCVWALLVVTHLTHLGRLGFCRLYLSDNMSVYARGRVQSHRSTWPYSSSSFHIHTDIHFVQGLSFPQVWLCCFQLSVHPRNIMLTLGSETDEEEDREMRDSGSLIYINTRRHGHSNTDKR